MTDAEETHLSNLIKDIDRLPEPYQRKYRELRRQNDIQTSWSGAVALYIGELPEGSLVVETGESCMQGRRGEVVFNTERGTNSVRWDRLPDEPGTTSWCQQTSITWGSRTLDIATPEELAFEPMREATDEEAEAAIAKIHAELDAEFPKEEEPWV